MHHFEIYVNTYTSLSQGGRILPRARWNASLRLFPDPHEARQISHRQPYSPRVVRRPETADGQTPWVPTRLRWLRVDGIRGEKVPTLGAQNVVVE